MKIISKLTLSLILLCHFNMALYAKSTVSITQAEQVIDRKYAALDFYEVNQDIESDVVSLIDQNPESYAYSFPLLTEKLRLKTHYSPGQLLKFYTFDVGGGGTMGEFSSYVQLKSSKPTRVQAVDTGYILKIDQVKIEQQPIYLVQSYYKGDSCHGVYQIQAFKKQAQSLVSTHIFKSKKKKLDSIEVDFDCHYDEERNVPYIRVSKDLKYIDIKLLDQKSQPTGKYLRYQQTSMGYDYTGVVK